MVTIDEIQERIKELELFLTKNKLDDRYENSNPYIEDLITVNKFYLNYLLKKRH